MKKLKSGIELYEGIPTTLRLRYASRTTLQKNETYTLLGVGRVPLRDGNSYDAAVLTDTAGNEIYVSIPITLGLVFKKDGESWTRKQIDNGGLNTIDQLEKLVDKRVKVKEFVSGEVTNFQGNNVEREFPVWEILQTRKGRE
jgi:hypothetical protein